MTGGYAAQEFGQARLQQHGLLGWQPSQHLDGQHLQ